MRSKQQVYGQQVEHILVDVCHLNKLLATNTILLLPSTTCVKTWRCLSPKGSVPLLLNPAIFFSQKSDLGVFQKHLQGHKSRSSQTFLMPSDTWWSYVISENCWYFYSTLIHAVIIWCCFSQIWITSREHSKLQIYWTPFVAYVSMSIFTMNMTWQKWKEWYDENFTGKS